MRKEPPATPRPHARPAPAAAPALGPAPSPCTAEFAKLHPLYNLPPTVAPTAPASGKGQPLQWAVSLPVNRSLVEIGAWRELGNGWSSIGLRLASENASGLSLRLSGINIADAAQIWVCTPGGEAKRGPLRDGQANELSTPVLPGAEIWLEVLSPTRNAPRTQVTLAEVFGGFR